MVTWSDVRTWNPAALVEVAVRLRHSAGSLRLQAEYLHDRIRELDEWTGAAGDAARAELRRMHTDAAGRTSELEHIARCVHDAAMSIYPVCSVVRECDDTAASHSMTIDDDGRAHDPVAAYTTSVDDAWDHGRDRLRLRRELTERATTALRRAREIDEDAAEELATRAEEPNSPGPQASGMQASGLQALGMHGPSTAPANAAFWETLTPAQRTALLVENPGSIGNLDGIPAHVRDAANRRMLVLERTRLEAVADDLRTRLDRNIFGGVFDDADAGLAQTEKRLDALAEIAEVLEQGNRQLLVLDNSSAEDTLAAIAVGNVHTATHVAVFVPGLDSDVAGDIDRYDGDMENLKIAVEKHVSPGETVACVTWANYQAPHTGWSLLDPRRTVLSPMAAAVGAPRLASFLDGLDASRTLDGLDASRTSDPHLSLIGHSYGSLTAALALRGAATTGVDDVVSLGSPGLGFDSIDALAVPPGHMYVGEADGDVVADLGVFGADPSDLDGITPLSTRPADTESEVRASGGHSEYLEEGTASQRNVAAIVAGRAP